MFKIFRQYYPIRNVVFFLGESLVIFTSILFSYWFITGPSPFLLSEVGLPKIVLSSLVLQTCLYFNDLYEFNSSTNMKELGIRLLQALGAASIVLAVVFFLFPEAGLADGVLEVSVLIVLGLIIAWRFLYLAILKYGIFNQKIMVLGSGDLAQNIVKVIQEEKDCGYSIALIMWEIGEQNVLVNFATLMPNKDGENGLHEKAIELGITKVIVALSEKRGRLPVRELLQCRLDGIEVLDGNTFFEMLTGKLMVKNLNPGWLIFSGGFQKSMPRRFFKRAADLIIALSLLILLSPLMLLVAILIRLDSPGPVFFPQARVGKGRQTYRVFKFRSMVDNAEKGTGPVWARENDSRITRVGGAIRKLRIDELPQLWNVLMGEMSFVGPRPERGEFVQELIRQIPYYDARLTIKPGLTGWAQINYPYGSSVGDAIEKLNYDLFYMKNMSFLMDMMITLRTLKIVVLGRGAR